MSGPWSNNQIHRISASSNIVPIVAGLGGGAGFILIVIVIWYYRRAKKLAASDKLWIARWHDLEVLRPGGPSFTAEDESASESEDGNKVHKADKPAEDNHDKLEIQPLNRFSEALKTKGDEIVEDGAFLLRPWQLYLPWRALLISLQLAHIRRRPWSWRWTLPYGESKPWRCVGRRSAASHWPSPFWSRPGKCDLWPMRILWHSKAPVWRMTAS